MAPPPPPMPSAPPPPLPGLFQTGGSRELPKLCNMQPDRNALLSQIKIGTRLKKVETNDRSVPLINGTRPSSGGSGSASAAFKSNGPSTLIPPGGLFAQGMPKLRFTGGRTDNSFEKPCAPYKPERSSGNFCSLESAPSNFQVNENSGSHSHPSSPASKLRQNAAQLLTRTDSIGESSRNLSGSAGFRHFPNDVNVTAKGPAPVPPPANQKPNFSINNMNTSHLSQSNLTGKNAGVRRSVSQTSLGPRPRPCRPPPNVRPPPPPKAPSTIQNGPPPPPSKPPSILRRQSFGVADARENSPFHVLPCSGIDMTKHGLRVLGPPPPPRNNSAPNNLNQMHNSGVTPGHVNKMASAPPPPPPPFRTSGAPRPPNVRPPPPPMRAPAPPPPPHRMSSHPAPPSQLKATPEHIVFPPPPPTRVSSAKHMLSNESISDFEARFIHKFHSAQSLPKPDAFLNSERTYPSHVQKLKQQSTRRQPPPPPPSIGNSAPNAHRGSASSHQPVLHIQLESRVFANNIAHC